MKGSKSTTVTVNYVYMHNINFILDFLDLNHLILYPLILILWVLPYFWKQHFSCVISFAPYRHINVSAQSRSSKAGSQTQKWQRACGQSKPNQVVEVLLMKTLSQPSTNQMVQHRLVRQLRPAQWVSKMLRQSQESNRMNLEKFRFFIRGLVKMQNGKKIPCSLNIVTSWAKCQSAWFFL